MGCHLSWWARIWYLQPVSSTLIKKYVVRISKRTKFKSKPHCVWSGKGDWEVLSAVWLVNNYKKSKKWELVWLVNNYKKSKMWELVKKKWRKGRTTILLVRFCSVTEKWRKLWGKIEKYIFIFQSRNFNFYKKYAEKFNLLQYIYRQCMSAGTVSLT